jgi:dienelactone hydrolase
MLLLVFGIFQKPLIGSPLPDVPVKKQLHQITIKPDSVLGDEEVVIKLSGFEPDQKVTLKAQAGNWRSKAIFKADSLGNVDLSKQAPISGTYRGIDGMGLTWSLKRTDDKTVDRKQKPYNGDIYKLPIIRLEKNSRVAKAGLKENDVLVAMDGKPIQNQKELFNRIQNHLESASKSQQDVTFNIKIERNGHPLTLPIIVHKEDLSKRWYKGVILGSRLIRIFLIEAEVEGKVVASTIFKQYDVAADVTELAVRENGLVGSLFKPGSTGPHPGIIVLGGASGGIISASYDAKMLASHGYAALALAYFAYEDLPPWLINIPLEYFGDAIQWMENHPAVTSNKIGVLGRSKGGELALLLGATFPKLKAVVAYVPSHVVWGGGRNMSSWTINGKPLDFVPLRHIVKLYEHPPIRFTPMFLLSLQNTSAVEKAVIPVERINGPVLLISGEDDQAWPSTLMSEMVMKRLSRFKHPFPYQHLSYEGAGHIIINPYYPTTILHGVHPIFKFDIAYGGNPQDNAFACKDSWPKVLQFLKKSLTP